MFTILLHAWNLKGEKSSSSRGTSLTLVCVVTKGIGVGSGIYCVALCTSYSCDSVIYLFWVIMDYIYLCGEFFIIFPVYDTIEYF